MTHDCAFLCTSANTPEGCGDGCEFKLNLWCWFVMWMNRTGFSEVI